MIERPARRVAAHLLLVVLGSALGALGIAAVEYLLRRMEPDYLVKTRGIHRFSSTYGWAGRPGAVAAMGGGRVSLNARGYRGRDLPLRKEKGRARVVVLGDSVAFGYGVADEMTFPHLLDVRDNGLEAANLAVEGYGPGQELLVLLRDGLATDPDLVVLAFCLRNDFADAVLPVALYNGVTPRPRFRLVGDTLVLDDEALRRSRGERALQWLGEESHLFNRLTALVPRRGAGEDPGWRRRKQEALRDEDYALRLALALVKEMDRVCRERGIAFLVATFPNGLGYGMKAPLPERLHRALEAEGVWLVDMGRRFRDLGLKPADVSLDETGHLGPRGHAVSCEILEREIGARLGARGQGDRPPPAGSPARDRGTPGAGSRTSG